MGERGKDELAQDLSTDLGNVLRFNRDGSIPKGHPFATTSGARPAIFTYGHRNPQGFARHPVTGELWVSEHGPQGGGATSSTDCLRVQITAGLSSPMARNTAGAKSAKAR